MGATTACHPLPPPQRCPADCWPDANTHRTDADLCDELPVLPQKHSDTEQEPRRQKRQKKIEHEHDGPRTTDHGPDAEKRTRAGKPELQKSQHPRTPVRGSPEHRPAAFRFAASRLRVRPTACNAPAPLRQSPDAKNARGQNSGWKARATEVAAPADSRPRLASSLTTHCTLITSSSDSNGS